MHWFGSGSRIVFHFIFGVCAIQQSSGYHFYQRIEYSFFEFGRDLARSSLRENWSRVFRGSGVEHIRCGFISPISVIWRALRCRSSETACTRWWCLHPKTVSAGAFSHWSILDQPRPAPQEQGEKSILVSRRRVSVRLSVVSAWKAAGILFGLPSCGAAHSHPGRIRTGHYHRVRGGHWRATRCSIRSVECYPEILRGRFQRQRRRWQLGNVLSPRISLYHRQIFGPRSGIDGVVRFRGHSLPPYLRRGGSGKISTRSVASGRWRG
mmetsp:Transcript_19116/g.40052  ORF Transcript_19116/g.40052 Transcript_19116/m.40052 type:complete len:266 (+) Transcript_19116:626-1423(+)